VDKTIGIIIIWFCVGCDSGLFWQHLRDRIYQWKSWGKLQPGKLLWHLSCEVQFRRCQTI